MTTRPVVVVIGGGAVGLSAALHLADLGGEVTVLERGHVASGSSGLSVGIVETQYVDPLDIELRVRSMEFFNTLVRDHQFSITRNGYLRLAHTSADLEAFERSAHAQRGLGISDARVLVPGEIGRIAPDVRCDDLLGGLFGASDGYIDGYDYCRLLARLALERGARVLTGVALTGREPGSQRKHRLVTTAGSMESDFVVNAAGAWAGGVGTLLGAEAPILPQRHQTALAHLPGSLPYLMPSVVDYIPHSGGYGLYFRHDTASQLIVGLHTEEPLYDVVDPDDYRRTTDYAFLETVAEAFVRRLPGLASSRLAGGWAGLYPVSPDGFPQVGPHRDCETVISACGVGGSGLQVSPAVGRLVAEWIVFGEARSVSLATRLLPSRESLRQANAPDRGDGSDDGD